MVNKIESIEDLQVFADETLEKWQEILNLTDWHIDVQVDETMELNDEGTIGQIDYNEVSKVAKIRLANPMLDFKCSDNVFVHSGEWLDFDITEGIERTIIHELLHLDFDAASESHDQKETAIRRMTSVFQSLKICLD